MEYEIAWTTSLYMSGKGDFFEGWYLDLSCRFRDYIRTIVLLMLLVVGPVVEFLLSIIVLHIIVFLLD